MLCHRSDLPIPSASGPRRHGWILFALVLFPALGLAQGPIDPPRDGVLLAGTGTLQVDANYHRMQVPETLPILMDGQNLGVIGGLQSLSSGFGLAFEVPAPFAASALDFRVKAPAGVEVEASLVMWGAHPAPGAMTYCFHNPNAPNPPPRPDPFGDASRYEIDHLFGTQLTPNEVQIVPNPVNTPYECIFHQQPNPPQSFGHAQIESLGVWVSVQVDDPTALPHTAVQLEFELGGTPLGRHTVVAFSHHHAAPMGTSKTHLQPGVSGVGTDLLTGDATFAVELFQAHGPGLPLDMSLQYHSSGSQLWNAVGRSLQREAMSYIPFGHGWTNLYTLRLFQVSASSERRFHNTPTLFFQDANGRQVQFRESAVPNVYRAVSGVHWSEGISPAFAEQYRHLVIEFLPASGEYVMFADVSPLVARFDTGGRLIELKNRQHARATTLTYPSDRVEITDASGRTMTWHLDASNRVHRVEGPGGNSSTWDFLYSGSNHSLVGIDNVGYGWQFDYEPQSLALSQVIPPGGRMQTTLQYVAPGAPNRWGHRLLYRFTEESSQGGGTGAAYIFDATRVGSFGPLDQEIVQWFDVAVSEAGLFSLYEFRTTFNAGSYWNMTFRQAGNVELHEQDRDFQDIRFTDAKGRLTVYERETFGANGQGAQLGPYDRLLRVNHPDGTHNVHATYGGPQHPARILGTVDRKGARTDYQYVDGNGFQDLIERIIYPRAYPSEPNRPEKVFAYNGDGELISTTDPTGVVTVLERSTVAGQVGLVEAVRQGVGPNAPRTLYAYDGLGRVVTMTEPEGEVTTYIYDSLGRISSRVFASGGAIDFSYDANGKVSVQQAHWGPRSSFTYDDFGRLASETHDGQGTTTYTYGSDHRVIRVTDPRGNATEYDYNGRGLLETERIPTGVPQQPFRDRIYQYNEVGSVRQIQDGQRITDIYHDIMERPYHIDLPETEDMGGNLWRPFQQIDYTPGSDQPMSLRRSVAPGRLEQNGFLYDDRNQLVSQSKGVPGSGEYLESYYDYDLAGRLTGLSGACNPNQTMPAGRIATQANIRFDVLGRAEAILDSQQRVVHQVSLDRNGRVVHVDQPDSQGNLVRVQTRTYQPGTGLLDSVDVPGRGVTAYTYDAFGRQILMTDPLGNSLETGYDPLGRPDSWGQRGINPDGSVTLARSGVTYDRHVGDVLQSYQALAQGPPHTTSYQYDSLGRKIVVSDPSKNTTSRTFDVDGNIASIVQPTGLTSTFAYDTWGRLRRAEHGLGSPQQNVVETHFDLMGRVMRAADGAYDVAVQRDSLGRVIEETVTDAGGYFPTTMQYGYDACGLLASATNARGEVLEYTYTSENQLAEVIFEGQLHGAFTYDAAGRRTSKQLGPHLLHYDWNAVGDLLSIQSAAPLSGGMSLAYGYDALGRRISEDDLLRGLHRSWIRDGLGRLISETFSRQGSPLYRDQRRFDEAGNRVYRNENGLWTDTTHNLFNQVDQVTAQRRALLQGLTATADSTPWPSQGPGAAVDGVPGTLFVGTNDDSVDRWLEVQLPGVQTLAAIEVDFAAGNTPPAGVQIQALDAQGVWQDLQAVALTGGLQTHPSSPIVPQGTELVAFFETDGGAQTAPFAVQTDRVRILQPAGSGAANGPGYVTGSHPAGQELALVVDEIRVLGLDANPAVRAFQYQNGNLVSDGQRSFTYDVQNRLVQVQGQGVDAELTYDPVGRLMRERDAQNGSERHHTYLGQEVFETFDENGTLLGQNLAGSGIDRKLGVVDPNLGEALYFLRDAQNTTRSVVDGQGQFLDDRVMNAWGSPLSLPGFSNEDQYASPYGFSGRRTLHGAPSLMDYRARIYDRELGRFLSVDPAGTQDGLNRYAYVGGDPIMGFDPSGRTEQPGDGGPSKDFLTPWLTSLGIVTPDPEMLRRLEAGIARGDMSVFFEAAGSMFGDLWSVTPWGKMQALVQTQEAFWENWLPTPPKTEEQTADIINETIGSADMARAIDALGNDAFVALCWARVGSTKLVGFLIPGGGGGQAARGAARGGRFFMQAVRQQVQSNRLWRHLDAFPPVSPDFDAANALSLVQNYRKSVPQLKVISEVEWSARSLPPRMGQYRLARTTTPIIVSTGMVRRPMEQGFIVAARQRGQEVVLLTGTHGSPKGVMLYDDVFLKGDEIAYGDEIGIEVVDITRVSTERLREILTGDRCVVANWCYSSMTIKRLFKLLEIVE